jgi:hypothetical protein
MGQLSGNSCNIITLFPLGVECNSVNSSTPETSNGLISLYITGGTAPYNVTWNNGGQGTLLTNLSPGNYTATVVDYYGDFSATTTCVVSYDSFYLEKFQDCSNSNSFVYYLANVYNPFSAGTVYGLSTQVGCWTSSGTTLYTGQTYINNFASVSSGPFTGCTQCLPPPVPVPVIPSGLCLNQTVNTTSTLINFYSAGTLNGYMTWTSVTPSYKIFYNSGTTKWVLSGYTNGSVFKISPLSPPTGNWTVTGPNAFTTSMFVSSGSCSSALLKLKLSATNPLCSTQSNGSIIVTGSGGVGPYTYSLNGVNYQVSNVFAGLGVGTYTVYIKDSVGTTNSSTQVLTPQQSIQNYVVSLNLNEGMQQTYGTATSRTTTWSISVSPSLPTGSTVNMKVTFNVNYTANTASATIKPTITNSITANTTPNAIVTPLSSTIPTGTSTARPGCVGGLVTTTAQTISYNVQLTNNGVASGTIVQYVNTPCVSGGLCALNGFIVDSVSIQNIGLTPNTCTFINKNVTPQKTQINKTGILCPASPAS